MIAAFVSRVGVPMALVLLGVLLGAPFWLGLGLCGRAVRAWWERRRAQPAAFPWTNADASGYRWLGDGPMPAHLVHDDNDHDSRGAA